MNMVMRLLHNCLAGAFAEWREGVHVEKWEKGVAGKMLGSRLCKTFQVRAQAAATPTPSPRASGGDKVAGAAPLVGVRALVVDMSFKRSTGASTGPCGI